MLMAVVKFQFRYLALVCFGAGFSVDVCHPHSALYRMIREESGHYLGLVLIIPTIPSMRFMLGSLTR